MGSDRRPAKVMIVEHDRTISELLVLRLDVAGYHPIAVRSATSALEVVQNVQPDAIMLDLHLPDLEGFDLLKVMSLKLAKRPTPILVMARQLNAEKVKRAIELGAKDCLCKPFSGADAMERVVRLLKGPKSSTGGVVHV